MPRNKHLPTNPIRSLLIIAFVNKCVESFSMKIILPRYTTRSYDMKLFSSLENKDDSFYWTDDTTDVMAPDDDSIKNNKSKSSDEGLLDDAILDDALTCLFKDEINAMQDDVPTSKAFNSNDDFDEYTKSKSYLDDMAQEISLLVRCNEHPNELLISEGRAISPPKENEIFDVKQLIQSRSTSTSLSPSVDSTSQFEPTVFFSQALSKIFHTHCKCTNTDGTENCTLDADGISAWLSRCLEDASVGKFDKRVTLLLSKYGTYKSGFLTKEQFVGLYMNTILQDSNDVKFDRVLGRNFGNEEVQNVWKDLRSYGINSPILDKYNQLKEEIQKKQITTSKSTGIESIVDECEILEWGDNEHSFPRASSFSQMNGAHVGTKKSSHELVELSSDGKTPKRIRDGQFVFVDEESCIGCGQCANVAPSVFVMLESGRARAFDQMNTDEVPIAVSCCPVSCIHNIAFHELIEMENGRDVGDGRSDHRHMTRGHTPLNVARTGNDMNHKSSWYHHLKHKCFTSKKCPQRGCFDCPLYAPGNNPYFKDLHKNAEHVRAVDFISSGEAEQYRNYVDL